MMQKYETLRQSSSNSSDSTRAEMQKIVLSAKNHLEKQTYYGQVGAFEGGKYQAKALYRPEVDCLMFSRKAKRFCHICQKTINEAIDNIVSIDTNNAVKRMR